MIVDDLFFRALIGAVFLLATVTKFRSEMARAEVARAVRVMLAVSPRFARIAARAGLALEALVVGLVAVPATGTIGLALAASLLAGYTAVLAAGLARGRRVACQCFGTDGDVIRMKHIVRNGLLTLLAGGGAVISTDSRSFASSRDLIALAAGLVVGWLATRWDDLAYLLSGVLSRNAPSTAPPR